MMQLLGELDVCLGHFRRYTREEIVAKLQQAGFTNIEYAKYFNVAGALVWFLVSKLLKQNSLGEIQARIFDKFVTLFKIEQFFNLPFGLSVIVVAKR
jgi:hypothetical protein